MPSQWEQVVVDAEDPARLARWWAEALGYRIVHEEPDEVEGNEFCVLSSRGEANT